MAQQKSWFSEHPWMTFFLASSAISGIVQVVRPRKEARFPPLWAPPDGFPPPPPFLSTYPSGYEVQGYHPTLKSLEARTFALLEEARAFAVSLVERGFRVAVRYVPPGHVPGDARSPQATLQFAQPADYNPWEPKAPREA